MTGNVDGLLQKLKIDAPYSISNDGTVVIDIKNSNEYGKYYSKLDQSSIIKENQASSIITSESAANQFTNDYYTLLLTADFENDLYKLTISEK